MVIPGESTTATGVGCVPGSQVVLAIGSTNVGYGTADSQGAFAVSFTPSSQLTGLRQVTATCGSLQLATLLAVVTTSTVSTPEGAAGVFGVFILLGAVLLRGQFTSNVTRRRRRRNRGAKEILEQS